MTSPSVAFCAPAAACGRRGALDAAAAHERSVRFRVGLTWGLLILNVLTFYPKTWSGQSLILPVPSAVGRGHRPGRPARGADLRAERQPAQGRPAERVPGPGQPARDRGIRHLASRPGTSARVRASGSAGFVVDALAAFAMVGPAGPASCPVPHRGDLGRARHRHPRVSRVAVQGPGRGQARRSVLAHAADRRSPSSPRSRSAWWSWSGWPDVSGRVTLIVVVVAVRDPLMYPYQDRPGRHVRGYLRRRPQPDRAEGPGTQVVRVGRHRVHRRRDAVRGR